MKNLILSVLFLALAGACRKQVTPNYNAKNEAPRILTGAKLITIPSVVICNQTWMKNNLDVSTYRNGDIIPQVSNPATWSALTTGAWCYYNNDPANGAVYGKLYN